MLQLDDIRILTGPFATFGPLTLALKPGRWTGVIGPHGSCKTLLLRTLAGLVKPDGGRRMIQLTPKKRQHWIDGRGVRYLPGGEPFDLHMRVGAVMNLRAGLRGYRGRKKREVLNDLREIWNLEPIWPRPLGELARGVRRRVAVADAFLGSPRVVLLDDPFWGCDDLQIRNIRDGLNAAKRTDVSVVVATRSRQELTALAVDVLELAEGGHVKFNGAWKDWLNQRADAGVYRLVARGPGGKIAGILKRVKGVYDVLWHEGGPWNTYELRAETEPKVREMIFRVMAVKNYPIIELAVEDNPHSVAEAEAARDQADVKSALKPKGTRLGAAGGGVRHDPESHEPAADGDAVVAAADLSAPPVPPPPGEVAMPPVPPPPSDTAPADDDAAAEVSAPVDLADMETTPAEAEAEPADVVSNEPTTTAPADDAAATDDAAVEDAPTATEPVSEPAGDETPEPVSEDAPAVEEPVEAEAEPEPAEAEPAPAVAEDPSEAEAEPVADPFDTAEEPLDVDDAAVTSPAAAPVVADTSADFTPSVAPDDDGWGAAEEDDGWGPASNSGPPPPPPPPLVPPEPDFTPTTSLPPGVRVVPSPPAPADLEPPPLPGEPLEAEAIDAEAIDAEAIDATPVPPDALDSDFDWTEGADLPPAPDWAASLPDGVDSPVYQLDHIASAVDALTGGIGDAPELSGLPDQRGDNSRSKTAAFDPAKMPDGSPGPDAPSAAGDDDDDDDVEIEEFDDVDFRAAAVNMSSGDSDDLELLKSLMAEEDQTHDDGNDDSAGEPPAAGPAE